MKNLQFVLLAFGIQFQSSDISNMTYLRVGLNKTQFSLLQAAFA